MTVNMCINNFVYMCIYKPILWHIGLETYKNFMEAKRKLLIVVTLRSENGRSGWGKKRKYFTLLLYTLLEIGHFTTRKYNLHNVKVTYKVINVNMYKRRENKPHISTYNSHLSTHTMHSHVTCKTVNLICPCLLCFVIRLYIFIIDLKLILLQGS